MALEREQILDEGIAMLREHGLGALSMRRLAGNLGVQAGALYWHVASKQDLLAALAVRILGPEPSATTAVRDVALGVRRSLLAVRDGAEVVSFALAMEPDGLWVNDWLTARLAENLPAARAPWAARTLTYFVLGAVAEEQNRAELVRADILESAPTDAAEAFEYGVDAIIAGLSLVE